MPRTSLRVLERSWKKDLNSILEDLDQTQFQKLLLFLDEIPKGVLQDRPRTEIPALIVQYYGTVESIRTMDQVLDQIPRRDARVQSLLRPYLQKVQKVQQDQQDWAKRGAGPEQNGPGQDQDLDLKPARIVDQDPDLKPAQIVDQDPDLKPAQTVDQDQDLKPARIVGVGNMFKTKLYLDLELEQSLQRLHISPKVLSKSLGLDSPLSPDHSGRQRLNQVLPVPVQVRTKGDAIRELRVQDSGGPSLV